MPPLPNPLLHPMEEREKGPRPACDGKNRVLGMAGRNRKNNFELDSFCPC